jgi:hypothetical protein
MKKVGRKPQLPHPVARPFLNPELCRCDKYSNLLLFIEKYEEC